MNNPEPRHRWTGGMSPLLEVLPSVPPANTTATCQHCGQEIEPLPLVGWVSTLSGDDGGTYDICPDGRPRYENDVEPPHEPEKG